MSTGYEPLDLSPAYNAGVDLYDPDRYASGGTYLEPRPAVPPLGDQIFHGLPFRIGSDPDRCLIALGPGHDDRVVVAVGAAARTVIFAHAVVETDLWSGAPVGRPVATYTFRMEGGLEEVVDIRERFEIGHVPVPWGQYPFLAVPDQKDHLEDRYEGRWERAGFRITEVGWAVPHGYYLWSWHNPWPTVPIVEIEVRHLRQRFVIAAVTLGHEDEDPFPRAARRPVRVTLDPESAADGELRIEVDRGTSTYTHVLAEPEAMSVDDPMRGFGVRSSPRPTSVYSEVAASPSATLSIRRGEETLEQARWGDVDAAGVLETPRARIEITEKGRNWVRVTVTDADTGEVVPCRIAFHSPEGVPYPPHGHHDHVFSGFDGWNVDVGGDVRLGQFTYAVIDGRCEGWLPRGQVLVDLARGYEYEPVRRLVDIAAGQRELHLEIRRWIDLRSSGWWSGDTHVHFLSPTGALNEAQAEDLSVVNLLMAQWGHYFSNVEDFTGEALTSADGRHVVWVSQENRQHILGHLGLLGLRRPVMPFSSGGPTEAELGGSLETTLSHWADEARANGATVVASHLPTPNGEPAALIATGRVDAVEMLDFLPYEHGEYYRYLNAGFRLPLVAGTDKMANTVPVGLYRTYVQLGDDEPFDFGAWTAGLRAGRTFVSGGAFISLEVDGLGPGSELHLPGGGTVEIHAVARSVFPIHTLQIVGEGRVVAATEAPSVAGALRLELTATIAVRQDTWLAARCAGPGYTATPHNDDRRRGIFAHSSPVYLRCGASYRLRNADSLHSMLSLVDGSLSHVRHRSRQYPADTTTHRHGGDHMEYLERPFVEARQVLRRLLEEAGE